MCHQSPGGSLYGTSSPPKTASPTGVQKNIAFGDNDVRQPAGNNLYQSNSRAFPATSANRRRISGASFVFPTVRVIIL